MRLDKLYITAQILSELHEACEAAEETPEDAREVATLGHAHDIVMRQITHAETARESS